MNIKMLMNMQRNLNERILREHNLKNEELYKKRLLAFLVELGELANETRSFKYWSMKPASEENEILEEYVDGLHFVLSICLDLGIEALTLPTERTEKEDNDIITDHFLGLYEHTSKLAEHRLIESGLLLFEKYIILGEALGFTYEQIEESYLKKNEVNHARQDSGY
ncbi:dUTP diphosphatase [Fictibacillus iocasae]|uniref:dUTP diphosphatase n=1 Tax=Fictibacillus iocasae TaxID=2715437 RepID=A0ABW2NLJ5_9BACL